MATVQPDMRLSYMVREPDEKGWPQFDVHFDLDDGCTTTVRFVVVDNMLQVRRVKFMSPDFPKIEPTTATFRSLRLGDIRLQVLSDVRADPSLLEPPADTMAGMILEDESLRSRFEQVVGEDVLRREAKLVAAARAHSRVLAKSLKKGPARGQGAQSPKHYRDTALMYLQLLPEHGQRVIAAMAKTLGRSRNTVSTWVRRAREEAWLTKSTQGKAGGEPGPKLIAWLEEQEKES